MSTKIRLGPVAVFLTVVAAVLATLAILTFSTARADEVLAERFASVTQTRYALEADGNRFLAELGRAPENAGTPGAAQDAAGRIGGASVLPDGGVRYTSERDGYTLTVEVRPAEAGEWQIDTWKITKEWEEEDPFDDLWLG